jgi:hypothetical protein
MTKVNCWRCTALLQYNVEDVDPTNPAPHIWCPVCKARITLYVIPWEGK